jgi:pimeloyl-ACP methyl ester carboxylesterase
MYCGLVSVDLPEVEPELVDDVAIHITGSGPDLVLLHANGGDHRDFDAIVHVLEKSWRVLRIDWPGCGRSTAVEDPSAYGFAEQLPAVLAKISKGPVVIMGNSVGGFAAISVASKYPELVRALVLIQPGGFTPRSPLALLVCRFVGSSRVSPWAMRALPRLYLRKQTDAVLAIQERAAVSASRKELVTTFASVWRSFADRRHDSRALAAQIGVPTLLVWGTRDPILPWLIDGRRARKALLNAELVSFRCGHQAFAEVPDEFLERFSAFTKTHNLLGP